jgi:hypothetical protein
MTRQTCSEIDERIHQTVREIEVQYHAKNLSQQNASSFKAATRPADSPAITGSPMATRSRSKTASRARSLRDVGGPGQTDTCVASGNPSKT